MKIWRTTVMTKEEIVENMISFIEKEERNLQASKMANDTKFKTDIVNSILDELEREINDEN
jgi:hypothetical protein